MPANIVQFLAQHILKEDPISNILNILEGKLEKTDIELHSWAFRKIENVHDFCLERLMAEKFKKVSLIAAKTPFWKSRFDSYNFNPAKITSHKDVERLPIVTRKEFSSTDVTSRSNLQLSEKLLGGLGITSGTNGYPVALYRGKKPGIRSKALFLWLMDKIRKENKLMSASPTILLNINIKFQKVLYEKTIYIDGLDLENGEKRHSHIYPLIFQKKPEILYTYPSNLKRLMYLLKHDGIKLNFLKAIIYTAENLNEIEKNFIKIFFNCPVYSLYGTAEGSFIAMECAQNGGFHLLKGWGYIEIVSPDGNLLPMGSFGRVVYTNYENNATPFIRYDTGDRGMLFDGGICLCGITGLKLMIEGRSSDQIMLPNGTLFTLHRLHGELSRFFYGKIFQLQTEEFKNKIRINIVPVKNFSESEIQEVVSVCQKTVGAPIPFEIKLLKHIRPSPSGKTPLLIKKNDWRYM